MKKRFPALVALLLVLFTSNSSIAQNRESLWEEVESAENRQLPKTAIAALDPIIESALADEAYDEAIKAMVKKIVLESQLHGASPAEIIKRLELQIAETDPALHPTLQAVLAHSYWAYFQRFRWRIAQRSQTSEAPSDDFETWDLKRILTEIDAQFTAALDQKESLQSIPIESYDALLQKGTLPDVYRPTLFDFLANEALAFYRIGEHGAVEAETVFDIPADSPIFDDYEAFVDWSPRIPDTYSPEYKAVTLYQALLRFHENDEDRSAFYDADLSRLNYASNVASGENVGTRYVAALERFIEKTQGHPINARASARLANHHFNAKRFVQAHQIASKGVESFPESIGGAECYNLIQNIERKEVDLLTENVWNEPWPTLDLSYRNLEHVYFRAYQLDVEDSVEKILYSRFNSIKSILFQDSPDYSWDSSLPSTPDYQLRTEKIQVPEDFEPGLYAVFSSHRPDFDVEENSLNHSFVWVSDLAMVLRTREADAALSGLIVNAKLGTPIKGAKVSVWAESRNGNSSRFSELTTDGAGYFELDSSFNHRRATIIAEHDGQSIANPESIWVYQQNDSRRTREQTQFFTDRSLYRPGQTVHYKGISFVSDQTRQRYETIDNRSVKIVFRDNNGREIETREHSTNEYGSFSGSFTAPSKGLMGMMSISTLSGPSGSTVLNVEEYKRPKFRVELSPPEEAPKLGESVELEGKATAYTGAAIGGAQVSWRVERSVIAPRWCWWWQPPSAKAIAHGTSTTENDGSFRIQFVATPDSDALESNEPIFNYTAVADLTDSAGETRSASTVTRAGFTALQAGLDIADWLTAENPIEISASTQSLDGEPQTAEGTIRVYKLEQPTEVTRSPITSFIDRTWNIDAGEPSFDPSNPDTWETGTLVSEFQISTGTLGTATVEATLPQGPYRAELQTTDRYGNNVTARNSFIVIDPESSQFETKLPHFLKLERQSYEVGETVEAIWGTGYDEGQAYIEILRNNKILRKYWTDPDKSQNRIRIPITEEDRGGITLRTTYVRENRAYFETELIAVPWSNKQLSVKWGRFRSKLSPGEKGKWTATITGPDAELAAAEMVATLYDASLDQYSGHGWPQSIGMFRSDYSFASSDFSNTAEYFDVFNETWHPKYRPDFATYRSFPEEWRNIFRYGYDDVLEFSPFAVSADEGTGYLASNTLAGSRLQSSKRTSMVADAAMKMELSVAEPPPPPAIDLSKVAARKNLSETAFFFPHLTSDKDGEVTLEFTMPEALTEWRFLGFAHDQELRSGLLEGTTVTAKDLMIQPNPPRFLREGDEVEFVVKVSNQSSDTQVGRLQLTFSNALTLEPFDKEIGNNESEKPFSVPAKQSRSYTWRIKVPDKAGVLSYKAVGATDSLSDGEEGFVPVLSRRILVTESLPLPIRGPNSKDFEFEKLLDSGKSETLQHQSLTLQMVSQPAWYAVMALPYLMEFPHECSEQLFSRYYANTLASHIANSDPKIRRVFDLWRNTEALDSPLEKNQELKSVLVEETPWLRKAKNESQARRQVGILFDENRLSDESRRALAKLAERQNSDGRWSWFPGGNGNDFISLYITTGFGRLRQLGVDIDATPALKALTSLDRWLDARYREIQKLEDPTKYSPSHYEALYLYGRSFFLEDQPIDSGFQDAVDFFLQQSRTHWTKVSSRQSQGHLALALNRFSDPETANAILQSLKERSLNSEENGMHWADSGRSWWWHEAPIETQSIMIEAFAEVVEDWQAVEDCKVWLLKQKQTQNWKTTKATADAVYALLLRGDNLLTSDELVSVSLGGETIEPENVEAGTGFYQEIFTGSEVKPEMGLITVEKSDKGVSWGSAHWQYLEDISKVTPHEATPLTLKKSLFVKQNSASGQILKPVSGPVKIGDELVVRLELRTDRDMEFVHLKDHRGSGTEPVNVLSRYRYQDGLGYYESTRDTASHFFFESLPKGTYVFEYSTRVQLKGRYQSGIAEIQCMYAPEFNSHSESRLIEVK